MVPREGLELRDGVAERCLLLGAMVRLGEVVLVGAALRVGDALRVEGVALVCAERAPVREGVCIKLLRDVAALR